MTDPARPGEPFDWDRVEPGHLDALVQAIADNYDASNPMVTNEVGVEVLNQMWDAGYRVVRHPAEADGPMSDSPSGPREATREDLMDIARNAAEYRRKLSTPRTAAGRALLEWLPMAYPGEFLLPGYVGPRILAIEAQSLPTVERLARTLHDIEPTLTCIATRNIPASFDCTKPDIDRATAILAALGPVPDASERAHQGAFHEYGPPVCKVCGQEGMLTLSAEPQRVAAPVEPGPS